MAKPKKDITQYDEDASMRIRAVFDCIAPELNKKNKRFYADDVEGGGRFDRLGDEFLWLKEAGVAIPTYNLDEPKLPLFLSQKQNFFKLFMNDIGLLAAMYMDGIQVRVLNGETDINFGSVYENFVCQELFAHGFSPTYFNSRKHGEVDFVVELDARVLLIEVKSGKHYARHRALDRLLKDATYGIDHAIVFDDDRFQAIGKIFYVPIYMAMFLKKDELPDQLIYDIGAPVTVSSPSRSE